MWIPSTFNEYVDTCLPTSFAKSSKAVRNDGVRIDHICIGSVDVVGYGMANAWPDFVMPHREVDDYPVSLRVSLS